LVDLWRTVYQQFHISGHPSARPTGRAQNRESSPAEDRRSTAVPRNQQSSIVGRPTCSRKSVGLETRVPLDRQLPLARVVRSKKLERLTVGEVEWLMSVDIGLPSPYVVEYEDKNIVSCFHK